MNRQTGMVLPGVLPVMRVYIVRSLDDGKTSQEGTANMKPSRRLIRGALGAFFALAAMYAQQLHAAGTRGAVDDLPRLQGGERIIAASGEVGSGMFPKTLKLPSGEIVAIIRGGAPHIGVGGSLGIRHDSSNGVLHRDGHEVGCRPLEKGRRVRGLILAQSNLVVPNAMLAMGPLHGKVERLPVPSGGEPHR